MDRSRQRNSRIEFRTLLSVESLEDRRLLVTNVVAPVIEPFPAAQIRLAGGAIPEDAAHTLFVTESLFDVTSTNSVPASPNQIGGFASADYHCTDEAFKAGLHADWDGITAVYKAILSSNEVNARDRFSIIGPVYNTNGELLAWNRNDFWDGQLEHAVQFDAQVRAITGSPDVWTGTDAFGRSTQTTANNWTTALSDASIGNATRANADWLLSNVVTSAAPRRLYCISIPTGQQLSPGPFAVTDPPAQTKDTTPTIEWEAAARAVHYDVTIAADQACQTPMQSFGNVTQNAVTTIPLPTGSYFACVSATSASGEQTLASNSPFAFEIVSDIAQIPPVANIGGPYVSDEGQVITFDGSDSFDPLDPNAVLSFEWDFDFDGTFDPWSHYSARPALFSQADFPARLIALRVTNADGMSDVDFTTWQVNETPPHATFLALPAPSSDGLTVQFAQASNTGNVSESIVKWHWQFANLGQSDDANPQYRFPASGIYSVSLTVTDSDGSSFTTTQSVSVTDGTPVAHAGGPYISAEGAPLLLDATATTDPNDPLETLKFEWDLNYDGTFTPSGITGISPQVMAADNFAARTIAVRTTDSRGLTDIATTTWQVTEVAPHAEFDWTVLPGNGLRVQFTDKSNTGTSSDQITRHFWNFGGLGASSAASPVFQFATGGTYQVELTVTDDDGSRSSVLHEVTVSDFAPIANAGGPYVSDEGQSILLDGSGTSDPNHANSLLQFAWDLNYDGTFGPEIVHGERPFAVSQQDFAARVIALRVTDPAGLSSISTTTWEVREVAPFVSFAWLLPEDSDGLKVQFFGAANTLNSSDTIAAWHWSFGAAGESTDPNPVITFPADGSYQVTLTVVDSDGSSASLTQTVTLQNEPPVADAGGPYTIMEGTDLRLDGRKSSDPSDEKLSFAWDLDNDGQFDDAAGEYPVVAWQSLVENSPEIADSGIYTIGVQVSDGRGGVDTATARLEIVNALPSILELVVPENIQVGQAVTFQASGADPAGDQDPLEFEWELGRRGEVITQGAVSQFEYVFQRGGQYWISVTLKDDDGAFVTTGFQIDVTANLDPLFRKPRPNMSDAS